MQESDSEEEAARPLSLSPRQPGDPESPSLSMLRAVWQDFVDDKASAEDVQEVISRVAGFVHFELETLHQQAEKGISDPENPTYQKICNAFELHLEALEIMGEEFTGESFLEGFELAQKATKQLIDAHAQTMEHIEAMANVGCIFCGHSNPREAERCSQCGRTLPGAPSSSSFSLVNQEGLDGSGPASGQITKNYVILAEAVAAWRNEALDSEQLLAALDDMEGRLVSHLQETLQYTEDIKKAPESARAALARAVAMTEEGLNLSLEALEKMKMAFEKEDDSYLETGLHEFEKASGLMVQAFHASKSAAAEAQ